MVIKLGEPNIMPKTAQVQILFYKKSPTQDLITMSLVTAYAYQLISRLNEGSMISSLLEANQIDRQPQIVHTRH